MAGAAGDLVLLFYQEHEADRFLPYDRYVKRFVRPVYNLLHRRQKQTGFYVSLRLLVDALQQAGCTVRVNDYRTARRHPDYPVGLVGFPVLLKRWDLPNPALLGPSLYDHPALAPDLMADPRFEKYLTLAPWVDALFRPYYGDACVPWFAGIDPAAWPDLSAQPDKDIDVLVYDQIYFQRERNELAILRPVCQHLERSGLRYQTIRYKHYDHSSWRSLLARSRSLLFLCHHETQGLAYQEAMASGVPVLAWDRGIWLDGLAREVSDAPVPASSVPFFDRRCGERFTSVETFEATFERFWRRLDRYRPRDYVKECLSPAESARIYLGAYRACVDQRRAAA
jgi:glycosyltransferase involved in cell wall biosynthesis